MESVVWVPTASLKPHPKNPNKHNEKQIERLCDLLQYYGWRRPIIVSNQSGYIVSGHGRLLAAEKMRSQTVPVSYQDFKDTDEEYGFLISDNSISQWSELDFSAINNELQNLGPDFNIGLLGIEEFALDMSEKKNKKDPFKCPHCGEEIGSRSADR